MRCFACGGPYHPASGHLFREFEVAYCGPCYRNFLDWMKKHMRRRWGGADFYAEAARSCSHRPSGSGHFPPKEELAGSNPAESTMPL